MDIWDIFDIHRCQASREIVTRILILSLENFNPQKSNFDKTITCDQIQHWHNLQCFLPISISLQPCGLHPGLTRPVDGQQGKEVEVEVM